MEWVETTGRSIEEAKDAALDQLGVDEDDAEFEILEEPRHGLFGRVRGEARLRARVRPTKPRPKEERRDRRGRRRPNASADTAAAATESPSDATAVNGAEAEPASREDTVAADSGGRAADEQEQRSSGAGDGAAPSRSRRGGRQRGTGPTRSASPQGDEAATDSSAGAEATQSPASNRRQANRPPGVARRPARQQDSDEEEGSSRGGGMDVSLDEQGAVAVQFLEGLVERLRLDADIVLERPEEEIVELNLKGDDLGMLIGAKGATLLAIQDLTRTVVQRRTSATNGRMFVDVAGYRRKRKEALERFSRQLAEEVRSSGMQRVLEPMSAADRKIVHDTVNEVDGVATTSEGEEPRRRVVIFPASN